MEEKKLAKREYMRRWRLRNLEAMRQKDRDFYNANRDQCIERARAFRREKRPSYLESKTKARLKKYGITKEQYDRMWHAQEGVCAICQQPELAVTSLGDRQRLLAVDHCHKTGKVRGLLCHGCNKALGAFRDSPKTLRSAALYVERFLEQP